MEDFRKETQALLLSKLNTIKSLSEETGISEPTLRKIKTGKGDVSPSMIKKVYRIFS